MKETDLHIQTDTRLELYARKRVLYHRQILENHIAIHPEFATTLAPWRNEGPMPLLIEDMVKAGNQVGVGPMAAVAGAIAAQVGSDLLTCSEEVIIENGGDIFLKTKEPVTVGIYAGNSLLSMKMGLRAGGGQYPMAVCTSSGTVGHSLSFGKADAVCVVAPSCPLADAAATAIGNRVSSGADIRTAVEWGKEIAGIQGIVVIAGDKMGAWGEIELFPLTGKKD